MIYEIGKHKVKHGNILDGIEDLMGSEKADIVYSDPPWGKGNLRYWDTINKRMNPDAKSYDIDYDKYINKVFDVGIQYMKEIFIIIYGLKWKDEIISMAESKGLIHCGLSQPLYRSGSKLLPYHMHIFSKTKQSISETYFREVEKYIGYDVVYHSAKPFKKENGIVLDACCGMGYCARASIEHSMIFRGNELNMKRLQKTINLLEKHENISK